MRCDDSLLTQDKRVTFNPKHLAKEIDDLNDWVYDTVNNGYIEYLKLFDFQGVQNRVAATQ